MDHRASTHLLIFLYCLPRPPTTRPLTYKAHLLRVALTASPRPLLSSSTTGSFLAAGYCPGASMQIPPSVAPRDSANPPSTAPCGFFCDPCCGLPRLTNPWMPLGLCKQTSGSLQAWAQTTAIGWAVTLLLGEGLAFSL